MLVLAVLRLLPVRRGLELGPMVPAGRSGGPDQPRLYRPLQCSCRRLKNWQTVDW